MSAIFVLVRCKLPLNDHKRELRCLAFFKGASLWEASNGFCAWHMTDISNYLNLQIWVAGWCPPSPPNPPSNGHAASPDKQEPTDAKTQVVDTERLKLWSEPFVFRGGGATV